jgi:hypothetical protein
MTASRSPGHTHQPSDGSNAVSLERRWSRFWFAPAEVGPLAMIRIGTAAVALLSWWSYGPDLQAWFGPDGMISPAVLEAWRSPYGVSLFDAATTAASLWALYAAGAAVLACLLVGLGTPLAAVMAAIFFASLLHRGPMLAGSADDCLVVMLWCLAVGRSGDAISLDALLRRRLGREEPGPSVRNRLSLSLLRVHASWIAAAAVLSQIKGDVWWDGTAAWWLIAAREQPPRSLASAMLASEYFTNALTHAALLFEIVFAAGVWVAPLRGPLVAVGLVAWPAIGWLAGEPAWGAAMAVMGLAWAPPGWFARLSGRSTS